MNRYRLWLTLPLSYLSYLVCYYAVTKVMPVVNQQHGCFSGGEEAYDLQFYTVFIPHFSASAFFVLFVSLAVPNRKLFYSTISSIVLITFFLGKYLYPYFSDYIFPPEPIFIIGLDGLKYELQQNLYTTCSLVAYYLSSLGSLVSLTIIYWFLRSRKNNQNENL